MKLAPVFLALTLFLACGRVSQAQTGTPPNSPWSDLTVRTRVEPALLKALLQAAPGEHVPMIVVMQDQAPAQAAAALGAPALVRSLQATAARSQAGVQAFLNQEQAAGHVSDVQSFWIFNGLALHAVPESALALAKRPDVALLRLDRYSDRLGPQPAAALQSGPGLTWGIQKVGADRVWSALHDTGQGVVVANLDTGVDFLHPALNRNYRGSAGKDVYQHRGNWFDATPGGTAYPYDGNGHGTHTMGTLAGQDGIGAAPGARWIAVRVLDNRGFGYDSWIHAGFQWILAPDGDPALRPKILNNSWGNSLSSSTEFQVDLLRLRQAGILAIFSAGNDGPDAGTVGAPAALPGALAVGATDSDDQVASFSSRGPSPWQEVKPLIAAPGVLVQSATPGGTYGTLNGTSMAAPHVSGIAALMFAANPNLTITATEYALTSTAVLPAGIRPNNDVGWGRVDAYAAVQSVAGAGVLAGTVMDAASHLPLPAAQLTAHNEILGNSATFAADADGRYAFGLAAGRYRVSAQQFGYTPAEMGPLTVVTGTTTHQDLALSPLPVGVLRGVLTDTVTGRPVTMTVSALGTPVSQTAYGQYQFALPAGTYIIEARHLGYRVVTATVTIIARQVAEHNFALTPAPRLLLIDSGAWYYQDQSSYFSEALDSLGYAYDVRHIKHPPADTPVITDVVKYDALIWSAPQDSPGMVGANSTITKYLSQGGSLLLTGQDVAFWDGGGSLASYAPYLHQFLKTDLVRDSVDSRAVTGQPDEIMAGVSLKIAGGDGANDQLWPDEIKVSDPDYGAGILRYGDGSLAGNRVGLCLPYRGVVLGFGFEAISTAADRHEVLRRALDYLNSTRRAHGMTLANTVSPTQVGLPGTVVTFTARVRNTGELGKPTRYQASTSGAAWTTTVTPADFTLAPCASAALTVTTSIPRQAGVDERGPFTLAVQPLGTLDPAQTITLTAKTPAPVLLVNHQRWYDVESTYTRALQLVGVAYDVWDESSSGKGAELSGPPASRLKWYPLVIWFTGYDWYQPLTKQEELQISSYLDAGGGLILSSPFYLDLHGDSAFARERLGVVDVSRGMTATQTFGSPGHPAGQGFGHTDLIDPYARAGFFTLDAALVPSAAAATAWRGDHGRAQAIARRQPGAHLVFWGIPLEALPGATLGPLLQRSLGWLGPLGRSQVSIDPPVTAGPTPVTLTLVLRNDGAAQPASLLAELPSGTAPAAAELPAGLVYDASKNTLRFQGQIAAGTAMTFSVPIAVLPADPGRKTGRVTFHDDRPGGLGFEQPLVIGVATADLSTSSLVALPARSGMAATVQMVVRNTGPGPAPAALVTGLPPMDTRIITGTAAVSGPGTVRLEPMNRVTWQGALDPGATATITYQIRLPETAQTQDLPLEMLAWDGQAGAWEWRTWLRAQPFTLYFPLVGRTWLQAQPFTLYYPLVAGR